MYKAPFAPRVCSETAASNHTQDSGLLVLVPYDGSYIFIEVLNHLFCYASYCSQFINLRKRIEQACPDNQLSFGDIIAGKAG